MDTHRFLTPSPVLGMYIPPTVPIVGVVPRKDTALGEYSGIETISKIQVTEFS